MPLGREDHHPETIRQEIDRAGAATLLTRRTVAGLWWLAAALLAQAVIMAVFYRSSYELNALIALSFALALAFAVLSRLAGPLASLYRRWQCARLEGALRQVPPEDVASALWPMRGHPLPDTSAIVDTLIHDLRPLGSEVTPSTPGGATGIEVSPVVRRRRSSRQ